MKFLLILLIISGLVTENWLGVVTFSVLLAGILYVDYRQAKDPNYRF